MAFRTLLERYETAVTDLYEQPPDYTPSGGLPSEPTNLKTLYRETEAFLYDTKRVNFNPDDVDYNWTKLKKGNVGRSTSLLKTQSRTLPVLAALDDVARLAKFQVSGKGLLFLAQQFLLQTGNAFVSTRFVNPLFVVGNAVPFLHLNRSLVPLTVAGIDIALSKSKDLTGKLQQETIDTWGNFLSGRLDSAGTSKNLAIRATQGFFSGGLGGIGKKLASPFKSLKNAISLGRNSSNEFGLQNLYSTKNFPIAQVDGNYVLKGDRIQELDAQYTSIPFVGTGNGNMFVGGITEVIKPLSDGDSREYEEEQLGNGGTKDLLNYLPSGVRSSFGGATLAAPGSTAYILRSSSGLRPSVALNQASKSKLPNLKLQDVYSAIAKETDVDDYIITRIKVGKFNMQFRSFIKDIKENVNTEMAEKNYIGRTERFVTYTNTKREVTFTLQLIAMHEDELLATHTRINYLIGSLFPQDAIQGLLQPPITFLTIGNLFSNQPGFFRNLSIDYPYSWEVRERGRRAVGNSALELPMGANITANFAILEKGTVFHQSPFHGVMEKF
jgi:hypothetical protein